MAFKISKDIDYTRFYSIDFSNPNKEFANQDEFEDFRFKEDGLYVTSAGVFFIKWQDELFIYDLNKG